MILGVVIDWLTKLSEDFKEFMINFKHPVLLYTGLFALGLVVFASVYSALHNKQ